MKSSPNMSIPDPVYLCTFYLSLEMDIALDLDEIAGGMFADITSKEGREILDCLL
jgi:hypothetical protein